MPPVPRRPRRRAAAAVGALVAALVAVVGCAPSQSGPAPAVQRTTPPPWDAPVYAGSYIAAAGLQPQRLDYRSASRAVLTLRVRYDGREVLVPARIGEDRVNALTAGLHTHDDTGLVYLEPPDSEAERGYTLGEFFTLWGVRLTSDCLADRCGRLRVEVSGERVPGPAPDVPLTAGTTITVYG